MTRDWSQVLSSLLRLVFLIAATVSSAGCEKKVEAAPPQLVVAVAASAAGPAAEIAQKFERGSAVKVIISSGSTGTLEKQIHEGAPFDLFLSADKARPSKLADEGLIARESLAEYARGTLVVWWPDEPARTISDLADLAGEDWRAARVALATPEHAPYGKAAREALTKAGIWDAIKPRLVYGEDVAQVRTLAETGNVDAAFLPRGLLPKRSGHTFAVPAELYEPVGQWLGVLKRSKFPSEARNLREALVSSRDVWEKAGFDPPKN